MNGSDNNTVKLVRFFKISWNFSSKLKILSFSYELMLRTIALRHVEDCRIARITYNTKKSHRTLFNDLIFLLRKNPVFKE